MSNKYYSNHWYVELLFPALCTLFPSRAVRSFYSSWPWLSWSPLPLIAIAPSSFYPACQISVNPFIASPNWLSSFKLKKLSLTLMLRTASLVVTSFSLSLFFYMPHTPFIPYMSY